MLLPIILFSIAQIIEAKGRHQISLYADVYKDREFFKTTFPWIIDNIGGEIQVDYYLLGSGKYSVPQMCTLEALQDNPFVQAQYLKCEAEDNPSDYCLCETGINPEEFKMCVRHQAYLASNAASSFSRMNLEITPLVELGPGSTVFHVSDEWFLKKICTIFGDYPPRGCVKPFACNGTEAFGDGKGLAQIDKECRLNRYFTTSTSTTPDYPPA